MGTDSHIHDHFQHSFYTETNLSYPTLLILSVYSHHTIQLLFQFDNATVWLTKLFYGMIHVIGSTIAKEESRTVKGDYIKIGGIGM